MTYCERQMAAQLTYCLACHRSYFCTVPRGSICARCWQAQRSVSEASAEILSSAFPQAHASAKEIEHLPGEAKQARAEREKG